MNELVIGILVLVALVHTLLGEHFIIGPIAASPMKSKVPPQIVVRILRLGWHLGSAGWLALAAIVYGIPPGHAIAGFAFAGAVGLFTWVRSHPAWPLMAILTYASLCMADSWPPFATSVIVYAAVAVAIVVGCVHFYWAAGGQWASKNVFPTLLNSDGTPKPPFVIPKNATVAVGIALLGLAALIGYSHEFSSEGWSRRLLSIACLFLGLRSIGEFKYLGISKQIRSSEFARLDDLIYTPLVILLCFGGMLALL